MYVNSVRNMKRNLGSLRLEINIMLDAPQQDVQILSREHYIRIVILAKEKIITPG